MLARAPVLPHASCMGKRTGRHNGDGWGRGVQIGGSARNRAMASRWEQDQDSGLTPRGISADEGKGPSVQGMSRVGNPNMTS